MKKFIDTNIKFKNETVTKRLQFVLYKDKKLPLPTEIEISESGTCNRKCSFCPRSDPNFDDTKLHNKIKNKSLKQRIKLIPMKKIATTDDIAEYMFYLIVHNNFIANELINITGGE